MERCGRRSCDEMCGEERVGGKSCGLWANVQKDRRKSWRLEIGDWVLEPAGKETASDKNLVNSAEIEQKKK